MVPNEFQRTQYFNEKTRASFEFGVMLFHFELIKSHVSIFNSLTDLPYQCSILQDISSVLARRVMELKVMAVVSLKYFNMFSVFNMSMKVSFRVGKFGELFAMSIRAASRCPRRGIPVMFSKMFHKKTEKDFEI